jgi:sporulation protein YabP
MNYQNEVNDMEENQYSILLTNRNQLKMNGVLEVLLFQENAAEIDCAQGRLQITGDGLHLDKLDLDSGELVLSGRVDSLYYPGNEKEKRGRLSRLFS